jgi:cytidylate kinase
MTLITLSAPYGAGGSQVGPVLAERLGVDFVDRAIPTRVAEHLSVPLSEALARDEVASTGLEAFLAQLAPLGQAYGALAVPPEHIRDENAHRRASEQVILEHAAQGRGVILGRAGAVVLREDPRALHVRLDGPHNRRIEQGMRLEGVDRETAERRLEETDKAREAYVRHFYRVEPSEPSLYHLLIDSTVIPLETCADIIALAAEHRATTAD